MLLRLRAIPFALVLLSAACTTPKSEDKSVPPHVTRAREIAAALADAGTKVDADDPESCAACHTAIVGEWRESMHSRAHQANDPIYAGMRTLRLGKEGPELAPKCSSCHHPRDVADADSKVARAGVSCATCHNLSDVHVGKKGGEALTRGPDNLMRGSHDIAADTSPVHGSGPALPAIADGKTLCLACHAEEKNKAGVPTCTTGVEMASVNDTRTCVSCHMPEVKAPNGPVSPRTTHLSHAFLGPHRAWLQNDPTLLRDAVGMTGRFDGERLLIALENKSAHGFPSGFPARMAMVVVRGLDAKGAEVWRNIKADPMADHPEAVLNKVYLDADGAPTLAAFSVKLARDNRLKPGERREISAVVPAGVARAEITLKFWLVAPPAAKKIGVAEAPEAKPVDALKITVERPAARP